MTKYSDNSSDTSGSSWQFKGDEVSNNNNDLTAADSQSFKYNAALVGKPADTVNNTNSSAKNKKNCFYKYLSNFWRPLKMQLIIARLILN